MLSSRDENSPPKNDALGPKLNILLTHPAFVFSCFGKIHEHPYPHTISVRLLFMCIVQYMITYSVVTFLDISTFNGLSYL